MYKIVIYDSGNVNVHTKKTGWRSWVTLRTHLRTNSQEWKERGQEYARELLSIYSSTVSRIILFILSQIYRGPQRFSMTIERRNYIGSLTPISKYWGGGGEAV